LGLVGISRTLVRGFWTELPNWGQAGVLTSVVDEGLNDTIGHSKSR
jgi:hypothetical protein